MKMTFSSLLPAQLLCAGLLVACADSAKAVGDSPDKDSATQDATPVWANVPETISPEWGAFFSKKGQGRDRSGALTPEKVSEDATWTANDLERASSFTPMEGNYSGTDNY